MGLKSKANTGLDAFCNVQQTQNPGPVMPDAAGMLATAKEDPERRERQELERDTTRALWREVEHAVKQRDNWYLWRLSELLKHR
ncbi:MAG TPA: hypothetical protein VHO06_21070 [Polyangia bacterium]|jgi:hypothetical protein|nr:hypothetical protein [Polyangia bacterium]